MWTHFPSVEKSIEKQNSRTIMPFPTLIMGLIVIQRDYSIGAHIVTRSIAHIKGSKTGVHTIPQDRVEEEGGDTEEEIDRFTSALETSA